MTYDDAQQYATLSSGRYSVRCVESDVLDSVRGKTLHIHACIPEIDSASPIIVVSHGAGADGGTMVPLMSHWASLGYTCVAPTHDDLTRMGSPEQPRDVYSPEGAAGRVRDISCIVDAVPLLESSIGATRNSLMGMPIGVAGHSYGAYTAMLIAGAVPMVAGQPHLLADPRFSATLILSGPGAGILGLRDDSWQHCHMPMMVMTGSLDIRGPGMGPEWRLQSYRSSPPGDKYSVLIEGARHDSFTGRLRLRPNGETDGIQSSVFSRVRMISSAFWDAFLKMSMPARALLESGGPMREEQGTLEIQTR